MALTLTLKEGEAFTVAGRRVEVIRRLSDRAGVVKCNDLSYSLDQRHWQQIGDGVTVRLTDHQPSTAKVLRVMIEAPGFVIKRDTFQSPLGA